MKAEAYIRYIHISPKKMRALAAAVVGMRLSNAVDHLLLVHDKAARLLVKVLQSAAANAVNNLKLNRESLVIKNIETGKGPFLKRWNPVSRGMAHAIKKRTSHIRVVVEERTGQKKVMKAVVKDVTNEDKNREKGHKK